MKVKAVWGLLKTAVCEWMDDNAPRLGAALSYYTVFALPPLFIIVIFIASLWFDEQSVRKELFHEVGGLVGEQGASTLQQSMQGAAAAQKTGRLASILAVATLVLTSTGVFLELQNSLNAVWGVKPKSNGAVWSFVKNRLLSFAMVLCVGFLLMVSLIISTAISLMAKYFNDLLPGTASVWVVVNAAASLLVITCLFAMIYKILPDVKIAWRDVWVGALITAVLFTIGKFLLGLYIARNATVSAYGAAGSVILILLWVYYSAQILLFGAEITQVYANRFGVGLEPKAHAEWILPGDQTGSGRPKRHCPPPPDRRVQLVAELRQQVDQMRAHTPLPAPPPA